MADLRIDIASEFTGRKAFNQAGKATSKLEGQLKKFGGAMLAAFSVEQVVAFGKAAAEAFIEDQKGATRLANAVKNLGLGFANPVISTYIDNLSSMAGIADDELRPAFQALLQQTGDIRKSQELMNLAIEVSRGSGESLSTVVNDLSQAYVGNTKGLKKYYLGLTQAELKTMSFTDITKKMNDQFKGSNAEYLKTYAGQMDTLKVAASEAQETIGKALMDSLMGLTDDGSIQSLADSMKNLADQTANVITAVGDLAAKWKTLHDAIPDWLQNGLNWLTNSGPMALLGAWDTVSAWGEKKNNQKLMNPSVQMFLGDMTNMQINNQAIKQQKKQVDAIKQQNALLKKQAMEKKQAALLDIQHAQLIAALKGNLTDEERKRLELQVALLDGNEEQAKKLSLELANSIDKTGNLAKYLTTLPDAKNPFKNWQNYLDAIEEQAKRIANMGSGNAGTPKSNAAPVPSPDAVLAQASADFAAANQQIKIIVEGGDEVTSLMRFKIQEAAQSGSSTNWSQSVGAWDR